LKVTQNVAIRVGDTKIMKREFEKRLGMLSDSQKKDFDGLEGKAKFADMIIDEQVIFAEALEQGFHKEKQIEEKIENARRAVLVTEYYTREIVGKIEVENDEVESYYEEHTEEFITRAVLRLSELRYGGLIVIEQGTGLRDFSESGKELNAELSTELLVTIFTPYTPLHDGAAIISGDYIVAAAASLPLTVNPRYRKLFGMRHKAAIGVSEVSDAVVIVVSEESSKISIAYDGVLDPDIDKSEFKEKLASYMKK